MINYDQDYFPITCPWTYDQIIDNSYYPIK